MKTELMSAYAILKDQQMVRISPNQVITNFKYNIEAAEASGYIVAGPYRREHYDDNCRPDILFAGSLDDCLLYIMQEIVKHDDWKSKVSSGVGF